MQLFRRKELEDLSGIFVEIFHNAIHKLTSILGPSRTNGHIEQKIPLNSLCAVIRKKRK